MMWLKKLLNKWVTQAQEDDFNEVRGRDRIVRVDIDDLESGINLRSRGIKFTMYKAEGGMVIESEYYDEKKDQRINSLHVCTDTSKLGEDLSKILTVQTMRM